MLKAGPRRSGNDPPHVLVGRLTVEAGGDSAPFPAQQLRQPWAGLIAGEQLSRRAPSRLLLEIDRKRVSR